MKGVWVMLAQYPLAGSQCLLKQVAGAMEVAQFPTSHGQTVHRLEGVGVVVA